MVLAKSRNMSTKRLMSPYGQDLCFGHMTVKRAIGHWIDLDTRVYYPKHPRSEHPSETCTHFWGASPIFAPYPTTLPPKGYVSELWRTEYCVYNLASSPDLFKYNSSNTYLSISQYKPTYNQPWHSKTSSSPAPVVSSVLFSQHVFLMMGTE